MAINFSWSCPYCNKGATITDLNFSRCQHQFENNNKDGDSILVTEVIVCPNEDCKEYVISGKLGPSIIVNHHYRMDSKNIRQLWNLKPNSLAKQFPSYIPVPIIKDYEEACLIKDLSPKASATLSRRCLQGMIRDFFGVSKNNLFLEIDAIKDNVDPTTWKAIDSVRSIGNIGAHMEKDINLIVDVEPHEAQILIELIEILIQDWYIAKVEREAHLQSIISLAGVKAEARKPIESVDLTKDDLPDLN